MKEPKVHKSIPESIAIGREDGGFYSFNALVHVDKVLAERYAELVSRVARISETRAKRNRRKQCQ